MYTYDGENNRVSDGKTTFVNDTNSGLSNLLMTANPDSTSTIYVYGIGLISQETGTEYRLFHYDFRGSTTALTDAIGASACIFLFVGKYGVQTESNGLYYMRARYYSPELGRFINEDPIRDGLNWYGYCDGNPVVGIDPSGLAQMIGNKHKSGVWLYYYKASDQVYDAIMGGVKSIPIIGLAFIAGELGALGLNRLVMGNKIIELDNRRGIQSWFGIGSSVGSALEAVSYVGKATGFFTESAKLLGNISSIGSVLGGFSTLAALFDGDSYKVERAVDMAKGINGENLKSLTITAKWAEWNMALMMDNGYVDLVTVTKTYTTGKKKGKTYTVEELIWYDEDVKKGYYDSIYAMRNYNYR